MPTKDDRVQAHILIDCGKHFRESVVRWGPRYGVTGIDAIVLTHDHAGAVLGLDDIRLVDGTRKNIPLFVASRHFSNVVSVLVVVVVVVVCVCVCVCVCACVHVVLFCVVLCCVVWSVS